MKWKARAVGLSEAEESSRLITLTFLSSIFLLTDSARFIASATVDTLKSLFFWRGKTVLLQLKNYNSEEDKIF